MEMVTTTEEPHMSFYVAERRGLAKPSCGPGDRFGRRVPIFGDTIVVGTDGMSVDNTSVSFEMETESSCLRQRDHISVWIQHCNLPGKIVVGAVRDVGYGWNIGSARFRAVGLLLTHYTGN